MVKLKTFAPELTAEKSSTKMFESWLNELADVDFDLTFAAKSGVQPTKNKLFDLPKLDETYFMDHKER